MATILRSPLYANRFVGRYNLAALLPAAMVNLLATSFAPAGQTPFHQTNWEVPRAAARLNVGFVQGQPLQQSTDIPAIPFVPFDWPNPYGPKFKTKLFGIESPPSLSQRTVVVTPPFFQTDWPVPRGPQRSIKLLEGAWGTPLTLSTQIVLPPFRQTSWPVPRGLIPAIELLNGVRGTPMGLRIFVQPPPFYQTSWPVPRGPQRAIDLLNGVWGTPMALRTYTPPVDPTILPRAVNPLHTVGEAQTLYWDLSPPDGSYITACVLQCSLYMGTGDDSAGLMGPATISNHVVSAPVIGGTVGNTYVIRTLTSTDSGAYYAQDSFLVCDSGTMV